MFTCQVAPSTYILAIGRFSTCNLPSTRVVTTILALYFQNLWLGTAHRKLSLIISLSFDFIKASCFASYLHMLYDDQTLYACTFKPSA
ncbi:hypothetical protein BDE02_06G035200 [Populus trichocarpa]|nr:hypothetical protein BDE02_06G035200 [Populus trichocarpa]